MCPREQASNTAAGRGFARGRLRPPEPAGDPKRISCGLARPPCTGSCATFTQVRTCNCVIALRPASTGEAASYPVIPAHAGPRGVYRRQDMTAAHVVPAPAAVAAERRLRQYAEQARPPPRACRIRQVRLEGIRYKDQPRKAHPPGWKARPRQRRDGGAQRVDPSPGEGVSGPEEDGYGHTGRHEGLLQLCQEARGTGWTYPSRGITDPGRRREQAEDGNPERRPERRLRVTFFGFPGHEDYTEPASVSYKARPDPLGTDQRNRGTSPCRGRVF